LHGDIATRRPDLRHLRGLLAPFQVLASSLREPVALLTAARLFGDGHLDQASGQERLEVFLGEMLSIEQARGFL
jgi:hypothetical protein